MTSRQAITILGSTGSIGINTLDVIRRHKDKFEVFALTAAKNWELLLAQIVEFTPVFAVMMDVEAAFILAEKVKAEGFKTAILCGEQALCEVASDPRVQSVMAAIVGSAGLAPCMAAAHSGKRLLLANKEALVVGGNVFMDAVRLGGATLLPIDSEHSAIFQSLPSDATSWSSRIEKIILTASGGPFLQRPLQDFEKITPQEACSHPNWVMGQKISVDSATMMNKALEVIEAKFLFGVQPTQIEVVIHPQSIIHSMVQYKDASIVAQLGTTDMRVPIAYGLSYPDRIESGATRLDFQSLATMTFIQPCSKRFPSLDLAWYAMEKASGPIVLNAANEVAVQAFLNKVIRFDQIYILNMEVASRLGDICTSNLVEIYALDGQARAVARETIKKISV